MIISGLDEAALGPNLGPFCVCLTSFGTTDDVEPELYEILSAVIAMEKNAPGRITIADSKVLYSRSTGIRLLETGVAAFLEASGLQLPCSFTDLLTALCPPSDLPSLEESPWFVGAGDIRVPWSRDGLDPISKLGISLEEFGVHLELPRLRFVSAGAFNRELTAGGGKGNAVRNIITPLLNRALDNSSGRDSVRRVTVDRQGGRRYYGEWLTELMPCAPLRAVEEGPKRSAYEAGERRIEFLVGADGICMEVALASMIAKYVRETAMLLFNAWWADRVPGIRPTAGYPQDARRFIADIDAAGAIPEDRDSLIRRL
jgi:hypothetical protein